MSRPANPWFRLWSELAHSQKFDENLPDKLVKPWLKLLAIANGNDPRGNLPSFAKIAHTLRVKEDKAKAIVCALVERHWIDVAAGRYVMHDWEDWQRRSDARDGEERNPKRGDSAAIPAHKDRTTAAIPAHREEERREREDQEREEEEEPEPPARRNIFVLYDQYMGKPSVTVAIRSHLIAAEEEYEPGCIEHCFGIAAKSSDGRRSWSYVEAILKRHQREGCNDQPRPIRTNGSTSGRPAAEDGVYAAQLSRLGLDHGPEFVADPYGAKPGTTLVDQAAP